MTDTAIPTRHGLGWNTEEEHRLYNAYVEGQPINAIAAAHERTAGGIRSCLKRLGLLDEDGDPVIPPPPFDATEAAQKRTQKAAIVAKRKPAPEPDAPEPEMNDSFRDAIRLMQETDDNLFVTGRAGTGKSTLLSYFCRTTDKSPVVLAPTGVAALNVKGQTIHRFFNFPIDVTPDKIRSKSTKPRNAKMYKKLRTIIVDEVSMVRADILDCADVFLRQYGPNARLPFGGVQMIFVGDLYQLPPVIVRAEQDAFAEHYATPYFFSAHVWGKHGAQLKIVELQQVYRQKDQTFVDLLNKIRNNTAKQADIDLLNARHGETAINISKRDEDFLITLTTTNAIADAINEDHLEALKGRLYTNKAVIHGDFGKEYYPTAVDLQFKIGSQIMLLNNDNEQRWVNGSIGVITGMDRDDAGDEYLSVKLQDDRSTVSVYPYSWEVYRYGVDTAMADPDEDGDAPKKPSGAIVAEPAGTFTQYPFRLAWGITIHKSQGKTFERVVIDMGRGAFAAGQLYVALSRCRSLGGITLKTPIRQNDIRTDPRIVAFMQQGRNEELEAPLEGILTIIRQAIAARDTLDITYLKADDTQIVQHIVPLSVAPATYQGEAYMGMKATLLPDGQERLLRVDRILQIAKAA